MADYSQWKVTDLKAELKRRGIPQTGLRLKQNIIDRLLEEDVKTVPGDVVETPQTEGVDRELAATEGLETQPTTGDAPEPMQEVDAPEKPEKPAQVERDEDQSDSTAQVHEAHDLREELPPTQPEAEEELQQAAEKIEEVTETKEHEEKLKFPEDVAGDKETTVEGRPADDKQRAERAATQDSAMADSPDERGVPSVPHVSAATTGLSTPLPAEEVLEDTRKRKRRSQSPILTPGAVANKKTRAEIESPRVVLKEDMEDTNPSEEAVAREGITAEASSTVEDREPEQVPNAQQSQEKEKVPAPEDISPKKDGPPALKQDARFKGLFGPADATPARPTSPLADTGMKDVDVEPALHVATAAIYVDGFMRPLQPVALRNHLISLATAPGAPQDPKCIREFYLDPIKTHCLVEFENISTASRVRSALHGTVWPNERNRKVLFADFVPEHKLRDWVRAEEDSQRHARGPPPRWIVKYEPVGDDDEASSAVVAVHQEVDPRSLNSTQPNQPARTSSQHFTQPLPPTGPRNSIAARDRDRDRRPSDHPTSPQAPAPAPAPAAADSHSRPGQGFKPLDDLFRSTTTKPKLYYLPVPREVADRRLDQFDDLARRGSFPRRGGDEARRFTFEDTDLFVDKGPEYPRPPPPHAHPPSYQGRRRRGRGGFGDSWVR